MAESRTAKPDLERCKFAQPFKMMTLQLLGDLIFRSSSDANLIIAESTGALALLGVRWFLALFYGMVAGDSDQGDAATAVATMALRTLVG